ncbi:ribosomal RNA small subunit methyltransferase G [Clostridia bacterium]|nr:ribosomal RNA small subunit methyltransferase G [Clostridia bacterium]
MTNIIKATGNALGIALPPPAVRLMADYADAVICANKTMNLTRITDPAEMAALHFIDSLALLKYIDANGKRIIDVGTGAGFPGVPLAIVCEDSPVTLIDSTAKKIAFVRSALAGIYGGVIPDRIRVESGRAEELARRAEYDGMYDIAVARAVAGLPVLCEIAARFLRIGGTFVAYKSRADDEIDEAKSIINTLGLVIARIEKFTLTGGEERKLIFIEKIKATHDKFPRKYAEIKKGTK